jgi:ferritin-like metal-binding protein YciE
MESIRELLVEEMRDLYDAEKQLVKALPKMAKASSNESLKEAFESHLEQTKGHVERLERAFEMLGEKAKGKPCVAMKGLIEEGQETMKEDLSDALLDSALICAAQKVEHYEMSGYGTLHAWAEKLGLEDVAGVLMETLEEEKEADEKLTGIAGDVMDESPEIMGSEEAESDEDEETVTAGNGSRGKAKTARR